MVSRASINIRRFGSSLRIDRLEGNALQSTVQENQRRTDTSTELARERSREASDRTLLAWIRTGLSLIGFGFGVGKFYDYLQTAGVERSLDPYRSTLIFGMSFIVLGIVGLFAAVIQHRRILKRIELRDFRYAAPLPLGMIMAIMLLVIGCFAFIAVML